MSLWQIEYWDAGSGTNPIEKWLDKLNNDQLKALAKEITLLEKAGNELKLPHSKALGKGLFELRERRYSMRVYYCFADEKTVIMLAVGDKKSQETDIKTARERLLQIKED